ncbi:MAG: hypothetical protein OXI87_05100 [Albidovulum sp.]|nr:hypothetical protein [Albidovulum sp.]
MQLRVWLPGTGPMIRRRLPVRETMPPHELRGSLQAAMGWEAIRLFQLSIRGVTHAGPHLRGGPADVPLPGFRFRRNGKFRCIYGMHRRRERELRVEDRVSATPGKRRASERIERGSAVPRLLRLRPGFLRGPPLGHSARASAAGTMSASG